MCRDDEEKRYHIPRRRRLGFPPITPNACVRDAVLHLLFDVVWSRLISTLSSSSSGKHQQQSLLQVGSS